MLFCTYSSLTSARKGAGTRLDQVVAWCGGAGFDGALVFDEAHRAKNGAPAAAGGKEDGGTKVARCVAQLQERLPHARVVYCSATGVSEVANMAYLSRLGFWGGASGRGGGARSPAPLPVPPPPPSSLFLLRLPSLSSPPLHPRPPPTRRAQWARRSRARRRSWTR